MADPHIQNLSIDLGQLHRLNALDSTKSVVTNLETLKSAHKQVRNPCLNNHMEVDEINDGLDLIDNKNDNNEENADNNNKIESNEVLIDEHITAINFKMEISPESKPSEQDVITLLCSKVANLIEKWILTKNVEGICIQGRKENSALKENLINMHKLGH